MPSTLKLRGREISRTSITSTRRSPRRPLLNEQMSSTLQNVFKVEKKPKPQFSEKIDPVLIEPFLSRAEANSNSPTTTKQILKTPGNTARGSRLFWPAMLLLAIFLLIWGGGSGLALMKSSPIDVLPGSNLDLRVHLAPSFWGQGPVSAESPAAGPVMSEAAGPVRGSSSYFSNFDPYRKIDF